MFKPALVTTEQFKTAPVVNDESTANDVFKMLHGAYGNLFLSKYATGVVDAKGRDQGVASARKVWAHSLRGVPEEVVVDALDRCQKADPEFPPSLPQFMEFCRACAPRVTYQPAVPAIAMSQELKSRNAARAREISARHTRAAAKHEPVPGLPILKALIAQAVAAAGGDEAAELMRLDRLYTGSAA